MSAAAPFFDDASDLLADDAPMLAYGACAFDADGDGRDEVFVCGFGDANRLLKWDGTQVIDLCGEDPAFEPLADPKRNSIGCCAADIDGDGREELYVLTSEVFGGAKHFTDRLFRRDGAKGPWVDLFSLEEHAAVLNLTAGRSVAALDRHGQGRYGFLLATYGGPSVLYEMDSRGRLYDMSEPAGLRFVTGGRSLLTGPLFGAHGAHPHKPDVFCGNENDANFAFVNRGDGSFVEMAEAMGLADVARHARGVTALPASSVAEAASGSFAIACGNWEGRNRLFIPRGATSEGLPIFVSSAPPAYTQRGWVRSVLAADFDHDGHPELFMHCLNEPNRGFRCTPGGLEPLELGLAEEPGGFGTGAIWCDIDGDGVLELLLMHGELSRQPLTLYKPRQVVGEATTIRPHLRSGAPARHALVTAGEDGAPALIDAGSGYLCQMPPVARFAAESAPDVQVHFPSGLRAVVSPTSGGEWTISETDAEAHRE